MSILHIGLTALNGVNKVGKLPVDGNGYRTVVLGAIDYHNSAGAKYVADDSVIALFNNSSDLQRRIRNGSLRGECGHPKVDHLPLKEQIRRIQHIDGANTMVHIKEVWIDKTTMRGADGRPIMAVMGKVRPSGPLGDVLEKQFENPEENVCFSIRSLTQDVRAYGAWLKYLRYISTWDKVEEPGIDIANRYSCPSLEEFSKEIRVSEQLIDTMIAGLSNNPGGLGMEGRVNLDEIKSAFGRCQEVKTTESGIIYPSSKW